MGHSTQAAGKRSTMRNMSLELCGRESSLGSEWIRASSIAPALKVSRHLRTYTHTSYQTISSLIIDTWEEMDEEGYQHLR